MSIILRGPWVEVDSSLIRGPQPGIDDLRVLQADGLTGVIDLRDESRASETNPEPANITAACWAWTITGSS